MFKTFIVLLSLIVCLSSTALAQIKEAQVGNVVSIRSDFDYQDPKELALYEAQKAKQKVDKNNGIDEDEDVVEPEDLFRVYLTRDRFYNSKNKYRENITFSITSHNMDRNYILDGDCPPYLEIVDNEGKKSTLNFSNMKFDNLYWISFSLTKKEIHQIQNIKEAKLILPEAMENMFVRNEKKDKIEKRKFNDDIKVEMISYDIPVEILQEWKQVLSADLSRK